MSALVPVVLLCGALTAKVAGSVGDADEPDASKADTSVVTTTPAAPAPAPAETAGGGVKAPEAPATIASIPPTLSALLPTSSAPKPTKAPVKAPAPSKPSSSSPTSGGGGASPTSGPTATPSPEEAEQQCLGEGVNPLDLTALARCIAEKLAGG